MQRSERMKRAEGRPLRRRMMAEMAQQDCGQCGYNCNDYSEAIAGKAEARLNLCVPGGKETARMLKALSPSKLPMVYLFISCAPPQIILSCKPWRIIKNAMPMECAPDAQAAARIKFIAFK